MEHTYILLDRIRETQLQHGVLLLELRQELEKSRNQEPKIKSGILKGWMPMLKPLAIMGMQAATGTLAIAYALKGGDIMTAISTLLKVLSSL